ncbi:DUF4352 domain-containing protein [Sphaerisporangium sp. TRM90804]|uniref:DUF4352 domain-containing protein n=1 Tax=Sphaerisporangium sp. TRM90804 TaxID=3031113 RepID=UPI00244BF63D|nr:DUF4352 domain-containing protein [Sphaerisporangium sp. TRM90804]MDH2424731.1 DUF4352 domain-containing protein [Sphaerisporangium sp. TRM90804]
MKTTHTLATVFVAALTLAACGSPQVTSTPDAVVTDTKSAEAAISMPSPTPSAAATQAGLGDTITVAGSDAGSKVAVKLNKVIKRAVPADEFTKPDNGSRFFAIEFALQNLGTVVYDDSPSNGTAIIDTEGQQYTPTIADVQGGVEYSSVTVSPGDKRRGLVVFEVPQGAQIQTVQLALDSGFANQTAEWRIR